MATATLPERTARTAHAHLLQETLVELIDLSLQGKQAHWSVVGPLFAPLHAELDAIVDDARTWYDDVAERLAALDVPPDGRVATIASATPLEALPAGWQHDRDVVERFLGRLEGIAARLRERIDVLGESDLISQDMLIGIGHGLDKHAWMLRAQVR